MRSVFAVICALLMVGCGKTANVVPAAPKPAKPLVTPDMRANGWVQSVNNEARFVIVRFPPSNIAPVGTQLGIYHGGLKVGVAKVTGPEMDGNTVADMISGEANVQDEARQE